ncbi:MULTISPECIES: response regulator [Roseivirga]|jgi:CheY-like chemotaxis protein|uniref:Two-component system response regulator n=1 Tax=Roseivirga thermotolerans TaxID=1758176 RepID=A0ABQ3I3X5_9BACT|nr:MULTISPECIES: response regulator [Roseivirga]MEC7754856.1 response regulator [Bacteroidota bacterium]GHE59579.1 two-component system response regulator [Roseivirga thermotolerans]|tara:strand:- start:3554 stop:3985 length:432 start_codon:yes stop_codon:yes gene_type:complete
MKELHILLVEDSPEDVMLTKLAFDRSKVPTSITVAVNGEECLAYLRQQGEYAKSPLPDLILLDLNMPKVNGKQVLEAVKYDDKLKHIPIIVLTTSLAERDIEDSYKRHANSYLAKPMDFNEFIALVEHIEQFWFDMVKLPKND